MHKKSFALIPIKSSGTMSATKAEIDKYIKLKCRAKENGRDSSN